VIVGGAVVDNRNRVYVNLHHGRTTNQRLIIEARFAYFVLDDIFALLAL
jgi:hypothetical protein